MMSIRRQLIGVMLAGLCVLFILSGTMMYVHVHYTLLSQFDNHLLGKAQTFIATTEQEHGEIEFEFEDKRIPEFQPSDRAEYFQVLDQSGETLVRSPSLERMFLGRVCCNVL